MSNGQIYAPAALPPCIELRCPLNRRLVGPQSKSGRFLLEFEPPTVQSVARRYVDYAIPTTLFRLSYTDYAIPTTLYRLRYTDYATPTTLYILCCTDYAVSTALYRLLCTDYAIQTPITSERTPKTLYVCTKLDDVTSHRTVILAEYSPSEKNQISCRQFQIFFEHHIMNFLDV